MSAHLSLKTAIPSLQYVNICRRYELLCCKVCYFHVIVYEDCLFFGVSLKSHERNCVI